jgi:hypothetical protein
LLAVFCGIVLRLLGCYGLKLQLQFGERVCFGRLNVPPARILVPLCRAQLHGVV